jgi:hypothetical protein
MMTGVPPDKDVNEAIALQNHPIAMLFRCLGGGGKKKSKPAERKVKYRLVSEIPTDVVRLIKGMTHYDPQQRTSVRTARLYPWIDDVLDIQAPRASQVDWLSFVLKKNEVTSGPVGERSADEAVAELRNPQATTKLCD